MKPQQRVPINFSITRRASVEIGRLTRKVCASERAAYLPAVLWSESYEESQRAVVATGLALGWYEASKVANDAIESLDGLQIIFAVTPSQAERFRGQIIDFDDSQFCFASSGSRLPK